MWQSVKAFLRSWGLVVLATIAGLAVAWRFVSPAPPDTVRFAVTENPQAAYNLAVDEYAKGLEAEQFKIERVVTQGSAENVQLLRNGRVDLALVQGGIPSTVGKDRLVSLGEVFFEPAWVFVRDQSEGGSPVQALRGKRIAVGPEGSGTRVLALALLAANGLGADAIEPVPLVGNEAAEALANGQVQAAVFVAAQPTEAINRLMRTEGVELLNFGSRTDAYSIHLPFLNPVKLPNGGLSLAEDLPRGDVFLMAPAASLLARDDLNPQVAALMMRVLRDTHEDRTLFSPAGRFPSGLNHEVPLQEDAERFYEKGVSFLQTYLPFRVAVTVERLWVLVIPLVGLLLPLMRVAPAIYTWQIERQLWAIYDKVRKVDEESEKGLSIRTVAKLDALDQEAAQLKLPDSYADRIYELRRHIAWLRSRKVEPEAA
ncbi:TAXI family TRAP transporter solute-binding subunit [Roseomonas xinghualingensis]|uniref:TAXI family TRAP transporter solute-binding subunit n=1 Tax=Roseomonas xinghualingensis TaxID=2986475 RepID=UPI0021F1C7AA|nr:TAXI family TRAP transporter solute-binding subunit [Roseomonas sp. SXEYE001]MCV4209070.1 ABC transporter substrate-binding protein [Roseomonas sp. SXEYE001]